jgi:hypothetical protein
MFDFCRVNYFLNIALFPTNVSDISGRWQLLIRSWTFFRLFSFIYISLSCLKFLSKEWQCGNFDHIQDSPIELGAEPQVNRRGVIRG